MKRLNVNFDKSIELRTDGKVSLSGIFFCYSRVLKMIFVALMAGKKIERANRCYFDLSRENATIFERSDDHVTKTTFYCISSMGVTGMRQPVNLRFRP